VGVPVAPPLQGLLDFGIIFRDIAVGFALHEMIFDAEGNPVDYRFLDANRAFEAMTGLLIAENRGKTIREALPGVEERWIQTYGRVVITGVPVLFTDFAEALGKYFEVWAYRPAPGRFLVMVRDVTESKASDRALADEKRRMEWALQATNAGLWDWSIKKSTVRFDGRWAEITGYDLGMEGELPLDRWRALCHPEDRGLADECLESHFSGASPRYEIKMRLHHRDGRWIWILDRGVVSERDGSGHPARMIGTTVEISNGVEDSLPAIRQASVLRAVLRSVDSAVAFKDLDGRYIGCNPEYERAFGCSESYLVGKSDVDLISRDDALLIAKEDHMILASGLALGPDNVWRKSADGSARLYERRKLPLLGEGGRPFGIAVFYHDVGDTVLSKTADMIHLAIARCMDSVPSGEILRTAVDELEAATLSELGFFVSLEDGGSTISCRAFSTKTGAGVCGFPQREGHLPISEAGLWAECVRERRPLIIEGAMNAKGAGGLSEGHVPLERILLVPVIRKTEVLGVLGIANKPYPYNDWDLALGARVAEFALEIFERKQAQERARDIGIQRDLAISAMRAGVETWYFDRDRKEYDENWAGILGYSASTLPTDTMSLFASLCHPDDYTVASESLRNYLDGRSDSYEAKYRMKHKDGRWIWVLERGLVTQRATGGEPLKLTGLIIDISELKNVEERLRRALSEKDVLLQELFHRTKNSMQLINAMLEMKKQGHASSGFNQAIETVQGKIIAMSLVQEKLYRNGDLSVLDLGEYISELIELMKDSVPKIPANVSIRCKTMAVPISVDAAVPCGLIVSELVSNALAHAFPSGAGGGIDVAVSRDREAISLSVRDDGVGLPTGFDVHSSARLGLKTVVGIGEEQLRGRVVFGSAAKGFSFHLSFKDIYYPRRL
jgi:PAS domain S-box-containing protein